MINNKNNTISLKDEKGKVTKYNIVMTFETNENDNLYVVYTDNTVDDDGYIITYAGIYNKDGDKESLLPVQTDEEWELIDNMLEKLDKDKKGEKDE